MSSRVARTSLLLLCAATVFTADASAARRRPVLANPSTGANCHTFSLVRSGLKASYSATGAGGDATFIVTYISDTPTLTITKQKTTTAQGTTDTDTRIDGEIVGNLRALKHINTKTVAQVPVIGSVTVEVDIDFVPSLAAGPNAGWCAGATWNVPPVTETITSRSPAGQNTQVLTTIASTGTVLAVGDQITVPAGTFRTVKYRSSVVTSGAPQPSVTWTSMDHSVVVRQETFDASGNLTQTTVLTKLE